MWLPHPNSGVLYWEGHEYELFLSNGTLEVTVL